MTKVKNMGRRQRKVREACHNGWFMSGEYRALFDNHERRFWLTARASCSMTLTSGSPLTSRTTQTRTCSSSASAPRKAPEQERSCGSLRAPFSWVAAGGAAGGRQDSQDFGFLGRARPSRGRFCNKRRGFGRTFYLAGRMERASAPPSSFSPRFPSSQMGEKDDDPARLVRASILLPKTAGFAPGGVAAGAGLRGRAGGLTPAWRGPAMRARMTARPRLRLAFSTHSSRVWSRSPSTAPTVWAGMPSESGMLASVEDSWWWIWRTPPSSRRTRRCGL